MTSTLSGRIRKILVEKGLKQVELADALGVSVNYISLLANGKKTNVSLTLAKLVESLYGYPAEWILTGVSTKSRSEVLRKQAMDRIMGMNEHELELLDHFIKTSVSSSIRSREEKEIKS